MRGMAAADADDPSEPPPAPLDERAAADTDTCEPPTPALDACAAAADADTEADGDACERRRATLPAMRPYDGLLSPRLARV